MTQDEIICMAREAGGRYHPDNYDPTKKDWSCVAETSFLERFAALVAAHEREKQAEQDPVASPDKGLWTVKQWGTDKVVLLSGDFTHDVALAISGDFLDIEQRLDYALNLATWMNHHLQNSANVRTKDLTDAYYELIYAVESKFPNESRHETALRYIRQAEQGDDQACSVIAADREKNRG